MSVQRSPPEAKPTSPPPLMYGSDSALNITTSESPAACFLNVTQRQKRYINKSPDNSDHYMSEIKNMISELKIQQDEKFESLRSSINDLVNQNQEYRKSVAFMSKQYDEMLIKVNGLEKENSDNKKHINTLESRLEILERNSRSATIEIRNVPKQTNESKHNMINIIKTVGKTLSLETPIIDLEVKEIYRSKSEALIVDFSNINRKESILTAYKLFNKSRRLSKEPQFNTQNLNILGKASQPVFISEVLTSKAGRLHFIARQLVKSKKIAHTWTSYGKVYVKKEEGQVPIRIEEEADLHKLTL